MAMTLRLTDDQEKYLESLGFPTKTKAIVNLIETRDQIVNSIERYRVDLEKAENRIRQYEEYFRLKSRVEEIEKGLQ